MKAMAIKEFKERLEKMEFPDPHAGDGEVVLDVTACGICQTDLKIVAGIHPSSKRVHPPFVPGHEVVGKVSEIGPGVEGWELGDSAIVYFLVGCGECKFCKEGRTPLCTGFRKNKAFSIGFTKYGGYGEKVVVPATNLIRISENLSLAEAAIIPDAISTAVHAIINRAEVTKGDRVLIFGAGGIGLHALQIAKICGGYVIVADIDPEKLNLAKELGADETFEVGKDDPETIMANKIVETSGVFADNLWVVDRLENGGTIVVVGNKVGAVLGMKIMDLTSRELTVKGSRASSYKDVVTAVDMVERGLIKAIVGTTYSFGQVNEALDDLKKGRINGRGVLVRGTDAKLIF